MAIAPCRSFDFLRRSRSNFTPILMLASANLRAVSLQQESIAYLRLV